MRNLKENEQQMVNGGSLGGEIVKGIAERLLRELKEKIKRLPRPTTTV